MRTLITKLSALTLIFILAMAAISVSSCNDEPKNPRGEQIKRGRALFDQYCSTCHGEDASGKAIDTLEVQPANLRHIMKVRRAPEFPVAEVARIIDGRKLPEAHAKNREMPLWGDIFRQEGLFEEGKTITEGELKGKLADIIAYLMAIQD